MHYSERLSRNFEDGDLITGEEAAAVLSRNSGRELPAKYVTDMVAAGIFTAADRRHPRHILYRYEDFKNYVVRQQRGPKPRENPTANALRQRKFKAKRRGQKALAG